MKVIRINWKLLKFLIIIVTSIYLLKSIYKYLFDYEYATLIYDYENRFFLIRTNHLKDQIDTNENQQKERVPFQIKSIKFQYTKTPVQLWTQLLEKAIQLGLNTIQIDIPWYLHHTWSNPNVFEFKKNSLDLETFIQLVDHYKLYLIVRIDPFYADSNYDLGGIPAWLLGELDLESREKSNLNSLLNLNDEKFDPAYHTYLNELFSILKKNQMYYKQGPLIGILIQTYNSKLTEKVDEFYSIDYVDYIRDQMYRHSIVENIITSRSSCETSLNIDSTDNYQLECDSNLDILVPIDNLVEVKSKLNKNTTFNRLVSSNKVKSNLKELLRLKKSFMIKNFYPGLNNFDSNDKYLIEQTGELTNDYKSIKQVLNKEFATFNSQFNFKTSEIELKMNKFLPYELILDSIEPGLVAKTNKDNFFIEYISADHNVDLVHAFYVIYSVGIDLEKTSFVYVKSYQIKDYSILVCNRKDILQVIEPTVNKLIVIKLEKNCEQLDLIVENSGRSSRLENRKFYTQRKGMLKSDTIMFKRPDDTDETHSTEWKVYTIDLKDKNLNKLYPNSNWLNSLNDLNMPFMSYVNFNVNKTSNTNGVYLSMKKWTKGVCVLNGVVLGHYTNMNKLYIPSFLFNSGQNDLILFELIKSFDASVYFNHITHV